MIKAEIGAESELTELSGGGLSFDNLSHELEELASRCVAGQRRLAFLGGSSRPTDAQENAKRSDDLAGRAALTVKVIKHDRLP